MYFVAGTSVATQVVFENLLLPLRLLVLCSDSRVLTNSIYT